jgi:hypothetical protein
MRIINWRFAEGVGTKHNTWQGRSVIKAAERMRRYWMVDFRQHPRAALTFRTRRGGATMAQSGNTIWVNADFKWGTSAAGIEQMTLTTIHEIGHWLMLDNKPIHAEPGNVMSEVIGDPYLNWTKTDMRWFGGLKWRSNLRPWQEPRHWYPKAMMGEELGEVSCFG